MFYIWNMFYVIKYILMYFIGDGKKQKLILWLPKSIFKMYVLL